MFPTYGKRVPSCTICLQLEALMLAQTKAGGAQLQHEETHVQEAWARLCHASWSDGGSV